MNELVYIEEGEGAPRDCLLLCENYVFVVENNRISDVLDLESKGLTKRIKEARRLDEVGYKTLYVDDLGLYDPELLMDTGVLTTNYNYGMTEEEIEDQESFAEYWNNQ